MFKVALGHSEDPDNQSAINVILKKCKASLGDAKPNIGILFAAADYDFQILLDEIKKTYPDIVLTGCSSFGEISSELGVSEHSVVVMLLSIDNVDSYSALVENISKNTYEKLKISLQETLKDAPKQPVLSFLFTDALTSNSSESIRALKDYFANKHFAIAGGAAADNLKFTQTFQLNINHAASNAASYLLLTEPLKFSIGADHAINPITEKHRVTKSNINVVYTIDNKSVVELYKHYVGEPDPNLAYAQYPLAVYLDDASNHFTIRSPMLINDKDGSITFAADVPERATVQIGKTSLKAATLEAATRSIKKAVESFPGKNIRCAIVISCVGRKEVLGIDSYKEIDLIKQELPENIPIIGYYSYGEIGQFTSDDPSNYYNHTVIVVLMGE